MANFKTNEKRKKFKSEISNSKRVLTAEIEFIQG